MGRRFQHPRALVESDAIGEGTRIWAFAHVLPGARIGRACNIGDHCYIEGKARIGNDVTIKNNVAVWDGVWIEDRVFVGPNVSFTNDARPRSRKADWVLLPTRIEEGATIGANATILCDLTIGRCAMVGAGAVVTRDVPAFALVLGNPGRVRGHVCRCGERLAFRKRAAECSACGSRYLKDAKGRVHPEGARG
ncbi:MAG: acyltransferase [Planctomycetota bacterium]